VAAAVAAVAAAKKESRVTLSRLLCKKVDRTHDDVIASRDIRVSTKSQKDPSFDFRFRRDLRHTKFPNNDDDDDDDDDVNNNRRRLCEPARRTGRLQTYLKSSTN